MYVYLATVPIVGSSEELTRTRAFEDRQNRDDYVKAWMRLHDPALDSQVNINMLWVIPRHG